MTVSELYKILEVLVKENPQGEVLFLDVAEEGYPYKAILSGEINEDKDLVLL